MEFIDALKLGSHADIRKCKKADLHNHFVLGGSRRYLREHTGRDIQPIMKTESASLRSVMMSGDLMNFSTGIYLMIYSVILPPERYSMV